ncbi:chorismate mutase [Paenibacillus solisilvae]|uniref:Chorismate mutase n=1 Tax=Paenibacillus solisilvae TaxID=2486751 RepID=A0ABW0W541_9BACL
MTIPKNESMEAINLEDLRRRIDQLDQEIISLLAQRFQLTETVGHYKAQHHLEAQDKARESQQFKKIIRLSEQAGLNAEYSVQVYRRIIDIVIMRHQELQRAAGD